MDLFKFRRKQEIGERAQRLLDNELLKQWWENTDRELWLRFKQTSPLAKDEIEYIKASIDALEGMKSSFESYVRDGKQAAKDAASAANK